jgi:hypothetical protein
MKVEKLTREQFIERNLELVQDRLIKQRIIISRLIGIPKVVFEKNKLIS